MKILIIGAGKVGASLAASLNEEGHDITIIDDNDTAIRRVSEMLDVLCIKGPGASPAVLREAGAADADLVLACTNMDEVNMLCALTSKRMGAKYAIARVREIAYTDDLRSLQRDLSIDHVINPEYSAALEITRLVRFPAAANVDTFFRGKVEMIGITLKPNDPIVGRPLSELFRRTRVMKVQFSAALRGSEIIIPNGAFVPEAGDKLYITGTPGELTSYLRGLGRDIPFIRSVFIVGGGRISKHLARILRPENVNVTIVESNEAKCRELSAFAPDALILHGDGTDQELLASEHFTENDAFLSLTGRDEDNLIIGLYALQQGIRKVVAKCNRDNYAAIARSAGLECIVTPKLLAVDRILRLVRSLQDKSGDVMQALYRIADGTAEAAEFLLTEKTPNLGVPLKDLKIRKGFLIIALLHEGEVVIPGGNTVLSAGDRVIIISHGKEIQSFRDIF